MHATRTVLDQRYLLEERLGRGGMADVFRAVDTETGDVVAVKILHGGTGDTRRFRSEVETLGVLDHPGVVRLHRAGVDETGSPYLVLGLVDGQSLLDEIAGGPLGLDRAVAIATQIADALAHAHGRGVVHRDVKPSNILLDSSGRARLGDFGIARLSASTRVTGAGMAVGSAAYLAPEQVEGNGVGPAIDVYALGLVVVECLTGTPCYVGNQAEVAFARLCRQPTLPADGPPWLRHVLAAMTARDPHERPTAATVVQAFRLQSVDPVLAATGPLALSVDPSATVDEVEAVAPSVGSHPSWLERGLVLAGLVVVSIFAWQALANPSSHASNPPIPPLPTVTTPTTLVPVATTEVPAMAAPPASDVEIVADVQADEDDGDDDEDSGRDRGNGKDKGKDDDD